MLPEVATISAVNPETPGVATYTIELQKQEARENFRFQPGQFNMLYLPGIGIEVETFFNVGNNCKND